MNSAKACASKRRTAFILTSDVSAITYYMHFALQYRQRNHRRITDFLLRAFYSGRRMTWCERKDSEHSCRAAITYSALILLPRWTFRYSLCREMHKLTDHSPTLRCYIKTFSPIDNLIRTFNFCSKKSPCPLSLKFLFNMQSSTVDFSCSHGT